MIKMFHVAMREFITTVFTKAFLIGMVLPPAIMIGAMTLMPLLMNKAAPRIEGQIAVVDQSGAVAQGIAGAFTPDEIAKRREARMKRAAENAPIPEPMKKQMEASARQGAAMLGERSLSVLVLAPEADIEAEKAPILNAVGKEKSSDGPPPRLALVVVPKDAVVAGVDKSYATYQLFTAPRLDVEVQDDISDQVSRAIVDARIKAGGLDVDQVRAMTNRPRADAKAVTKEGEKKTNEAAKLLIPAAFMILLWISVFTCGQQLLTTTIEEKSSRVMEVLLSAVSPMQLMTGKIIGQMAVGMLILGVYGGAGAVGLIVFSLTHLLDPMNFVYLAVYYVIAFFLIAALMAAVGSAVSDIREAQTLMGPIMIVLIIPMVLWLPIMRNPNSMFAQVVSFIPPVSPFVMVLRLAGPEPVPVWQIIATIVLGFASVVLFLWAAAKIFRIGVLMYGKPPNFKTLLRWVRMA